MNTLVDLWVYLSATPLVWLTATLVAYGGADALSARLKRHPLANPVLITVATVSGLLIATGTSFPSYFAGAQFIHFLLGPATVALAFPLWQARAQIRRYAAPLAAALVVGSVTAIASATLLARAFGLTRETTLALAPKSATAPIAMGVAQTIGAEPGLTAALVILTGVVGAILVTPLMNALKITDPAARGFAVGVAAHGIGTARAFQVSPVAGAFAAVAIGLNGVMTALLTPWLLRLLL